MKRLLVLVFALAAVAAAQTPQATYDLPPTSGKSPLPSTAGLPPFPGAGAVIATQGMPFFPSSLPFNPDTLGAAYDRSRNVVWLSDQNRGLAPDVPSLYSISNSVVHSILTTVVCYQSACITAPGVPVTSSQYTDISIMPSRTGFNGLRNLLAVEFNGDLAQYDDHMVEIDVSVPTAPNTSNPNVVNVWYLDSASCPASCRPNTNTNVPQSRIDPVILVEDLDYIPGETANNRHNVLIGASCGDYRVAACSAANPAWHFVELTQGCPGTWRDLGVAGAALPHAPFQWYTHFMTYNPLTQSYFATDNGNGNQPPNFPAKIYEFQFDYSTMPPTPNVLQSFPGWEGYCAGVGIMGGTNQPHLMKSVGRRTTSIGTVDTGEQIVTLVPAGGNVLNFVGGIPNANKPWLLGVSLSANFGIQMPDRDRFIPNDPDIVFFLTVSGVFGNSGTLDAMGNGTYTMPVSPGFNLQCTVFLLGNPNRNDLGINQISNTVVY